MSLAVRLRLLVECCDLLLLAAGAVLLLLSLLLLQLTRLTKLLRL
jgi:hypothetical protein